jgi:hypothetical protein
MRKVINQSTKSGDAGILSKYNVFDNDTAEELLYTLPGFESIPLADDPLLSERLSNGDSAIFLTPLKTDIKPGERRIYATDSSGNVKSEIFMDKDGTVKQSNAVISVTIDKNGKIEIKGTAGDLTAFIHELATSVKDLITSLSTATVPTTLGPQLLSIAPDLIAKIPAANLLVTNINTFKK